EAWQCALGQARRPSVLCLSRQALPAFRDDAGVNKVARGGYVAIEPDDLRDVTLIATGSEVAIAIEAARRLSEQGIHAAVVSMPCVELFTEQDAVYRAEVLGFGPRVGIEAAVEGTWPRLITSSGEFVGMTG